MNEKYAKRIEGLAVEVIIAGVRIEGELRQAPAHESDGDVWWVGGWIVRLDDISAYRITE